MIFWGLAGLALLSGFWQARRGPGRSARALAALIPLLLLTYIVDALRLPGILNLDARGILWLLALALLELGVGLRPRFAPSSGRFRQLALALQPLAALMALMKLPWPSYALLPIGLALILLIPLVMVVLRGAGTLSQRAAGLAAALCLWAAAWPFVDRNWQPLNGWLAGSGVFLLALAGLNMLREGEADATTSRRDWLRQFALWLLVYGGVQHFISLR